jgi:hypothetical protein
MDLFGLRADSEQMQAIFAHFNTIRRPELADRYTYHDWVLVRRAGVELGFCEEYYHKGDQPVLWGKGALLFTQVYFYAGFDDVAQYGGTLPFGMRWLDTRENVRIRMGELANTLHTSDISDVWDAPGYRITVHYTNGPLQQPNKIVCMQQSLKLGIPKNQRPTPSVSWMVKHWGDSVDKPLWRQAWGQYLNDDVLASSLDDGIIDLSHELGINLHVQNHGGEPLLRAISFFGNGHDNATQWIGDLPLGLNFDYSPHQLFKTISDAPVKRHDGELTGYAVWHTSEYTLHVLYSFVYNRILRIKLLAPGTWKSTTD